MTFTKSWRILFLAMLSFALVAAIACGGDDDDAPAESAAPAAKAPAAAPEPTAKPAEEAPKALAVEEVSRDDTLMAYLGGAEGRFVDHELWNPYAIGANHQSGPNIIFEPLAFFSAFDSKTIPWLAESWDISPDGLTYTFHIRQGVHWHNKV